MTTPLYNRILLRFPGAPDPNMPLNIRIATLPKLHEILLFVVTILVSVSRVFLFLGPIFTNSGIGCCALK